MLGHPERTQYTEHRVFYPCHRMPLQEAISGSHPAQKFHGNARSRLPPEPGIDEQRLRQPSAETARRFEKTGEPCPLQARLGHPRYSSSMMRIGPISILDGGEGDPPP